MLLDISFILFLYSFILCDSRIILYDYEIMPSPEKFDCIYVLDDQDSIYGGSTAGKIPYCRRPDLSENPLRAIDGCRYQGEKNYFVDLLKNNIQPFEVLAWSSNIEMADEYAAFYYSNVSEITSNEKHDFLCQCKHPSMFGKYCEYELTHEVNSFELSHILQANTRMANFFHHQVFGDIVCYKTLSCVSGPLCLDWQNICDGEQQCENGWDEENCDKLEFNECEENEYRCRNGMCIPEEYWLDGEYNIFVW